MPKRASESFWATVTTAAGDVERFVKVGTIVADDDPVLVGRDNLFTDPNELEAAPAFVVHVDPDPAPEAEEPASPEAPAADPAKAARGRKTPEA